MSILCAIRTDEGIWIASDSLATAGGHNPAYPVRKWFSSADGIWYGLSGSYAFRRVIQLAIEDERREAGHDAQERAWEIAGHVVKRCIDSGMAEAGKGKPLEFDLNLLLVIGSRLFDLAGDLAPSEVPPGRFVAIGSGHEYGYGAAHAWSRMPGSKGRHREMLTEAIAAACKYDSGCGGEMFLNLISEVKDGDSTQGREEAGAAEVDPEGE